MEESKMAIDRIKLVKAIYAAQKDLDYDTYKELLSIYYKLIEQENINENFITEFTTYEKISRSALQLIVNA